MAVSRSNLRADRELEQVPRWAWEDVLGLFVSEHKLGQHVAIEGPNGSGKTLLALELLKARGERQTVNGRPVSITVLVVKRRDDTAMMLLRDGWTRITKLEEWPPRWGEEHAVFWPPSGAASSRARRLAPMMRGVLNEIESSGSQIVFVDEEAYFEENLPDGLGMKGLLQEMWRTQRSNKVTLVAATQRPSWVTRYMWSEAYWMFLFRPEDEDDLKTIAMRSGFKQTVLDVVPSLGPHDFLMLRRRPDRLAVISRVEL